LKMFAREESAQGGFEYLLLIGAAILLVVLVLTVVRNQIFTPVTNSSATNATSIQSHIQNLT